MCTLTEVCECECTSYLANGCPKIKKTTSEGNTEAALDVIRPQSKTSLEAENQEIVLINVVIEQMEDLEERPPVREPSKTGSLLSLVCSTFQEDAFKEVWSPHGWRLERTADSRTQEISLEEAGDLEVWQHEEYESEFVHLATATRGQ